MKRIRVLVVDDSALMRKMIPQMLSADPGIEVVGTAMDGIFALNKINQLQPDVVTLDVDMPRMDGLATLKVLIGEYRLPVIIVSSLAKKDAELTLRALEMGAYDCVMKPQSAISVNITDIRTELTAKVRAAYENPPSGDAFKKLELSVREKPEMPLSRRGKTDKVLAVGVSTGGPNALSYLLPRIPRDFPAAIVIVQHMPKGFTEMFAARLNSISEIEVREAKEGDLVLPGRALIAPGDRHLRVKKLPLGTIAVLSDSAPLNGHKPSADALFFSVAAEFGRNAAGLIMTGMGIDGAEGMENIHNAGGHTLAQDEKSCVVFGMPKAAIQRKCVRHVLSLEDMGDYLKNHYMHREVVHG